MQSEGLGIFFTVDVNDIPRAFHEHLNFVQIMNASSSSINSGLVSSSGGFPFLGIGPK